MDLVVDYQESNARKDILRTRGFSSQFYQLIKGRLARRRRSVCWRTDCSRNKNELRYHVPDLPRETEVGKSFVGLGVIGKRISISRNVDNPMLFQNPPLGVMQRVYRGTTSNAEASG